MNVILCEFRWRTDLTRAKLVENRNFQVSFELIVHVHIDTFLHISTEYFLMFPFFFCFGLYYAADSYLQRDPNTSWWADGQDCKEQGDSLRVGKREAQLPSKPLVLSSLLHSL